jgi:hypothetical protein
MNPLNHFGIRTEFIRGDTSSYNKLDKYSRLSTCKGCGEVFTRHVDEDPNKCDMCVIKERREKGISLGG